MKPTKVLETQNTINSIDPEASSISTSNKIPEITPIKPKSRTFKKKQ